MNPSDVHARRVAVNETTTQTAARIPPQLLIALATLGLILTLDVVPGVFIPDDNNYLINVLMLREGRVTVANTEGLRPSRELLFFDPAPWSRAVEKTPVASTAPPLYAPMALLFSFGGWRGLVALNTLAFLVATLVVFRYAGRHATSSSTPWLAAAAFALGGYVIEYAEGLWPHALSIALCASGIVAGGRLIESGRMTHAAAAGFLLALASGVRYQNAVLLPAVGFGMWLFASHWRRALVVFALAAAVPLTASSVINHARLDTWNPISKGKGYMRVPLIADSQSRVSDPAVMFWAQVVDYSARPRLLGRHTEWDRYDQATGAHLMMGFVLKKAMVQSAPWTALALLMMAVAWFPHGRMLVERQRQMRFLSLSVVAVLATFAFAGVQRYDGLAFNQRYFLELLPLLAVAFAWAVDSISLSRRAILLGSALGVGLVLLILRNTPIVGGPEVPLWTVRQVALLKVPLVLAAVLLVLASLAVLKTERRRALPLAVAVGLCLGWGLGLHILDDLQASHALRRFKLARTAELERVLPDHSALVAYFANRDPAVPLLFHRDIVILDAVGDEGEDAPALIRELLAQGRRVFLLKSGFSPELLDRVMRGFEGSAVTTTSLEIVELREHRR